jgi:formylglycine-generating enzyme required for sulfatase activity
MPRPKDTFKDCPDCPGMVVVPAGHFIIGSPESEPGRESGKKGIESPQHDVTIGTAFAVGRFAVTVGEFATFVRETNYATGDKCWTYEGGKWEGRTDRSFHNPGFAQDDRHPAMCVSWNDAKAFVAWLSRKTGKTYRLLSEAEREYVTRAGTTTPFWWGSSITPKQANYNGYKGSEGTVPVDSFEPNPWGLYQVHGNVSEWTEDCWYDSYEGAPTDGSAWTCSESSSRVLRGGSWYDGPQKLRSADCEWSGADSRNNIRGFRLARTLAP